MEELELDDLYQIDKKRLFSYYERIRNQFKSLTELQVIVKFLNNQSIGTSSEEVKRVLEYYQEYLAEGKEVLDFAFEWIRANKIRLEYKKYLIRGQYPVDKFSLAIDDCLYLFFLNYDSYIRLLFKQDVKEFEIAAIYEIFFSPFDRKRIDLNEILQKYKNIIPTIFNGNFKLESNIHTLRSGLSEIIFDDYKRVLSSRKEEQQMKQLNVTPKQECVEETICEFNGAGIERMIKTYCINKKEISSKDIENSVSQLLTSYFKFGKFYKWDEFSEPLSKCLVDYICSGLTDKIMQDLSFEQMKEIVNNQLAKFRTINKIKVLDGLAWINDLKPMLKSFITRFVDDIFDTRKIQIYSSPAPEIRQNEETEQIDIDFSVIFDINLEIEEYRQRLEKLLNQSDMGIIKKRNIIRQKVQDFQILKRRQI